MSVGDNFWLPHNEQIFTPCEVKGVTATELQLEDEAKTRYTYPKADLKKLDKVYGPQLSGIDNIVDLEEVSIAAVLHTVRSRFLRDSPLMYTRVSRIVIAVNPFKALPIYDAEYTRKYLQCRDSFDLPAHIYAIGADAINGLRAGGKENQAVLISGESGAGKTESMKLILSFVSEGLAGTSDGGGSGLPQDKIMRTNPIMESFGNAMTVRNNNSSRFGKWMQLPLSNNGAIEGCMVTDYLLEQTRVTGQGSEERNYHIFFMVFAAKDDDLKALGIGNPQDYALTKSGKFKAPGIDDKKEFQELKASFNALGYSEDQQMDIYKTVVGILNLGNAEYKADGDEGVLTNPKVMEKTAEMLGIQDQLLQNALCQKTMTVGASTVVVVRTAVQCGQTRDGVCRMIYGILFKWLIKKINEELGSGEDMSEKLFFGVLDIAGFESFAINSLEQLWINLSNEHLQNHFNNHIFKLELDDYQAEGIDALGDIAFQDNLGIINLLDSKTSVLATLDEEQTVPNGSDKGFCDKVLKAFVKHENFVKPKFAGIQFGIKHFAGEVMYTADGFLDKNVDKPPEDAVSLFKASSNSIVVHIGNMLGEMLAEEGGGAPAAKASSSARPRGGGRGGGGKKAVKTVSSSFRSSLQKLISKLNEASPHFVRCVKPNPEKVPGKVNSKLTLDQLNYSGVFEAVRIRQSGFASRIHYEEFIGRYRMILPKAKQRLVFGKAAKGDAKARAKIFSEALPETLPAMGFKFDPKFLALGNTKVFLKIGLMHSLDSAKNFSLTAYAIDIQRFWKGYVVRKMMKMCREVFDAMQEWSTANPFYAQAGSEHTAFHKWRVAEAAQEQIDKINVLLKKADRLPLKAPNRKNLEEVCSRMGREVSEVRKLKEAVTSLDPLNLERALARIADLELPALPEVEQVTTRLKHLQTQIPLIKAMQTAIEERDIEECNDVLGLAKQDSMEPESGPWITELGGQAVIRKLVKTIEELVEEARLRAEEEARRAAELLEQQRQAEEAARKKAEAEAAAAAAAAEAQ